MNETEQVLPLTTNEPLSKKDLVDCLQKADIPDDAECTLLFDDGKGVFELHFYWSEGAGAFGQQVVSFDVERKFLMIDFLRYCINLGPAEVERIKDGQAS